MRWSDLIVSTVDLSKKVLHLWMTINKVQFYTFLKMMHADVKTKSKSKLNVCYSGIFVFSFLTLCLAQG